jgi:hypothetical protein
METCPPLLILSEGPRRCQFPGCPINRSPNGLLDLLVIGGSVLVLALLLRDQLAAMLGF